MRSAIAGGLSNLMVRIATRPGVVALVERYARRGAVSQAPAAPPLVALTFDDGPHPVWTPKVLDALDEARAKATFFVVGRAAARFPEIVVEARRRGHEIGSHLYTHERGVASDDARFAEEIARSRDELASLLGERVRWLRFPYGERGRQSPREIKRAHGMDTAHWTYSAHDGKVKEPRAIVSRVAAGLRPGVVVLLHDALFDEEHIAPPYVAERGATLAALPGIAALLAARGLRAVTLSELLPAQ